MATSTNAARGVAFTLDLEDGAGERGAAEPVRGRHPAPARLHGGAPVRGTVFVVGELAEDHPDLVRKGGPRSPVAAIGATGIPFLGGVYLRVLPWPIVRLGLASCGRRESLWAYCHAHDFDSDEPFRVIDGLGWTGSRLFFAKRGRMFERIDRLIRQGAGPALGDRVAAGIPAARIPVSLLE
jgi:hypothetical protein